MPREGTTVRTAIASGIRQALSSPRLLVWLWVLSLLVALPDALLVHRAVERSVGPSRVHEDLRQGFDMDWYSEYSHETTGVERLLTPTSVRPAALLDNLDDWSSGRIFHLPAPILALGGVFLLLWTLLSGGILYRFVYRQERSSLRALLSHGADLLPRFLRLLVISGLAYYAVYRAARWIFPRLEEAMRDVTVERTVLAVYLLAALGIVLLLLLVKLASDYAKVATVLGKRRSMLLAAWHGLRFVLRRPLTTFGAYAGISLVVWSCLGVWALLAPGQGQESSAAVAWAFLFGQLAVVLRLAARLTAYGAAVEIYRDHRS